MNADQLFSNIKKKKSFLCIGLDTDPQKIPANLFDSDDPVFEFNKRIVEATKELVIAYKPNLAFYEAFGTEGIKSLEKTVDYIKVNYPDIFLIADAKRGDIGNTASFYARAFYQTMEFDAITLSPYMGEDSVSPFLSYSGKWVILLALTSNAGSEDFQFLKSGNSGKKLFENVLQKSATWGDTDNTMFVVGATHPELFSEVRKIVPEHFLLVPGVGAQGGELETVCRNGLNSRCGLIVNVSRSIIFADSSVNFDKTAYKEALKIQSEMAEILKNHQLI
jgi:orotidine-5'-phosphate decarboxylase